MRRLKPATTPLTTIYGTHAPLHHQPLPARAAIAGSPPARPPPDRPARPRRPVRRLAPSPGGGRLRFPPAALRDHAAVDAGRGTQAGAPLAGGTGAPASSARPGGDRLA